MDWILLKDEYANCLQLTCIFLENIVKIRLQLFFVIFCRKKNTQTYKKTEITVNLNPLFCIMTKKIINNHDILAF